MDILGWEIPVWSVLLTIVALLVYQDRRRHNARLAAFVDQGIPGPVAWPFVGNLIGLLRDVWGYDLTQYVKYGKPTVVITTIQGTPNLVVFDKNMVKQVMVKDFSVFANRQIMRVPMPAIMMKMVTMLQGEEWRNVRAHLSPTFSASKMRRMMPLINHCGRNVVCGLEVAARAGDEVEVHELAQNYALDAISRVAFGLDYNCYVKGNAFSQLTKDLFHIGPLGYILFFIPQLSGLFKKFGYTMFNEKPMEFFLDIVDKAITERKDSDDASPSDFLQLMIEGNDEFEKMKSEESSAPRGLTRDEILAQCLVFFIAGNAAISNVLYLTLYNLARHQQQQQEAYSEVEQLMGDNGEMGDNGLEYDGHKKLRYVEMCMEETMRLYTPTPRVDRECSDDVTICGIRIPKGTMVQIPISAFHHDPDVWDDPETFDPERFAPDAKQSFAPYQYMPFGGGPRMCVAQRLAMAEVKLGLAYIIHRYRIVTTEKTQIPLKVTIQLAPKNGLWLKFIPRNQDM